MNKIHLTGPAVRNNRSYVDAGVDVEVGDKADQISAARAAKLIGQNRAIDPDVVAAIAAGAASADADSDAGAAGSRSRK